MAKIRFKKHIAISIWIPLFLAVNLYCYFKIQSNNKAVLTDITQRVISHKNSFIIDVSEQLRAQLELADLLSHSLSLRRKIIKHNQLLLEKSYPDQKALIESEIDSIWNKDTDSEIKQSISTSLEAVFLRDYIKASNSIVDKVFVTDAFGFVRASSYPPDNINYFFEDWWQRALMVKAAHFYRYHESEWDQRWYLFIACPLYNDDGLDPVGVINLRLNLETLFISLENFKEKIPVYISILTDQNFTWEMGPEKGLDDAFKPQTFPVTSSPLIIDKKLGLIMSSSFFPDRYLPFSPTLNWSVMAFEDLPDFYSLKNPAFQTLIVTWIFLMIVISGLSLSISAWISKPMISFLSATHSIVKRGAGVTKPDDPVDLNPADILYNLKSAFEDATVRKEKLLRESLTSMKAISEYIKTAALEFDHKLIAESLLNISAEKFHADAGILFIQNPEYESPMILLNKLSAHKIATYTSLRVYDFDTKRLYFSWHHQQHQAIWDDGFQVLVSVPIQTRQMHFGTLYLLFKRAIELEIENDQTLDLLAQQCAVYSSRSTFFHQLERQVSFTAGILSGIPWFICTIDRDMRITWHNKNTDIPFDKPTEQLIGTTCYSSFKGRNTPCSNCPVKNTFQNGLPHETQQTWYLTSNETRQIRMNTFLFKEENKEGHSVILFIRDITSDIETQSEIRRYSMAIDNMGEAVIIADMEGKIIFINKAFTRMFDYTEKNVLGHRLELLFGGEESGIFRKIVTAINHEKIWTHDMDLLDRNEKRIPTSITATPALDEANKPIGLIISCFDLTTHLSRERQIIENYKELEILHKINRTLGQTTNLEDLLQSVLVHVMTFTGSESGAILLYQKQESDEQLTIKTDPKKPYISNEVQLPGYFSNFIDEYRRGRKSVLFDSFQLSANPIIMDNLRAQDSIESKLITRMGFKSMLAIPFQAHDHLLGIILLFSKNSYHFSKDNIQVYQSISALTGVEVYGRYLHEKLLLETKQSTIEKAVSRIGTDVQQVLQRFNISRRQAEKAFQSRSLPDFRKNFEMIDWKFWVLNQIAQNLLAYESKDNKLFFPEDINFLVASWLKQIKNFFYLDNVSFTFTPCTDIEEVYIHKVSIRRAFINLLTLAINTCWSKPDSVISVNIQSFYSKQDFYVIEIKHNGPADKELIKQIIESTDRTAPTTDLPVLLSSTIRILDNHKAQLSTAYPKGGETVFRMLMPQYPIKT